VFHFYQKDKYKKEYLYNKNKKYYKDRIVIQKYKKKNQLNNSNNHNSNNNNNNNNKNQSHKHNHWFKIHLHRNILNLQFNK
jgi:hypothetical protein